MPADLFTQKENEFLQNVIINYRESKPMGVVELNLVSSILSKLQSSQGGEPVT